jgi:hypothetical protein
VTQAYSERLVRLLGLNQRYKVRAVETTGHHHQFAISSSSTMSDLPDPQSYYIFANIPSADRRPVGATVLEGEEVLRAVWDQKMAVS